MPRFRYRALRPGGGRVAGEIVAADERDAATRLQAAGSFPIEIAVPVERGRLAALLARPLPQIGNRLAARDLVLFTRQLATLLDAGIMLDRALGLVGGGAGRAGPRRLSIELLAAVNRGESLSGACAGHPALPRHYAMVIAAGEARGDTAAALDRLADLAERRRATSRALLDALIYPATVLVVAIVSISFLLGFVLPRFAVLLTSFQREPPLTMRLLLAASTVFRQAALPALLVALAGFGFAAIRWRDPAFRVACHRGLLALPGIGGLIGKVEAERLLYLLGSLVASGIELPQAIAGTRAALASAAFRAALGTTGQRVERGDGVADALAAGGVLPEVAGELVRVGEETGDLAPMMLKAADMLRREFEASSHALIGFVTPLSIMLLGLLIGAVAVALLGTVMEVYDVAV